MSSNTWMGDTGVVWCWDIGCLLYARDHLIFIDPPFCHLRPAASSSVMISLCLFNCSVYVDQIACGETDWQHQYLHHHNPTTTTTTSYISPTSSRYQILSDLYFLLLYLKTRTVKMQRREQERAPFEVTEASWCYFYLMLLTATLWSVSEITED